MKVRFHIPLKLFGHHEHDRLTTASQVICLETICSMPALPRIGEKVSFAGTGDLGIGEPEDLVVKDVLWHSQIQDNGTIKHDFLTPLVSLKESEPAGWQKFGENEHSITQEIEEFKKVFARSESEDHDGHTFYLVNCP